MKTIFDLSNKNAIVTGGGSGIGRAVANSLAQNRAHVFIFDLDQVNGQDAVKEIQNQGGQASFITCDVSDLQSVTLAFEQVTKNGTLDILINNAGIAHVGNITQTEADDFEKVYNVNIRGTYHCLKMGVEHMKNQGGSIINMSSVAAHVGVPDRFAYSMSKGAVHAMTLSVAKDYVSQNIRCNSIAPARIHTPFVDGFIANNYPGKEEEMFQKLSKTQPIGRMGMPEEVGALALYLCSDEASFVTGTCFPIDGGFTTLNS